MSTIACGAEVGQAKPASTSVPGSYWIDR